MTSFKFLEASGRKVKRNNTPANDKKDAKKIGKKSKKEM